MSSATFLMFAAGPAGRFTAVPGSDEIGERAAAVLDRWRNLRRKLGDRAVDLVEEPHMRMVSWRLPTGSRAPARARRLTRARLAAWGMEDRCDVAELLVSELVTNAVRHGRGPVQLTLSAVDDLLRCEVADADTALPQKADASDDDENGRGLQLLDQLACCWGGSPVPGGKVVWFELPGRWEPRSCA
ncbi:ATP-binding protein [Microbispora sp. RL4-1S]|uniref:ATP-binding protein n=1 Tax=Microbispora oryzae TaxID=2806554 RepID=A0A940WUK7_9ACTN|nr:ATP-binding protein [Microbispora oryzae]MBP2707451.1 ATP-binding protein [Microbispora oryzae]